MTPARRRAPLSSSAETPPRCPCTNALIRTANKSGDKKKRKKDCIQTRISEQAVTQTALFRGGERVRATRHYSCNLSKTVGERKHCLWFKAQANKMGDRALCLLSAVRLECKAVGMKGAFTLPQECWCLSQKCLACIHSNELIPSSSPILQNIKKLCPKFHRAFELWAVTPCFMGQLGFQHPLAVCRHWAVCYFLFELTCSPSVPWPPLYGLRFRLEESWNPANFKSRDIELVWQKSVQLWLSLCRSGRLNLDPSSTHTHSLPNSRGA